MNSTYKLPKLRILFAEDVSTDREMVERLLKQNGILFVSECVDTEPEFRKMLIQFKPDIILSDYRMPTFDGMKALRIALELTPDIPFIILTGSINEDIAVECMRSGADDYVIKQNLKRLVPSIVSAMEKKTLKKSEEDALKQLKSSDMKYRMLIDQSIDAIFLVFRGRIVYINHNFQRMFGITLEEISEPGFNYLSLASEDSVREMAAKIQPAIDTIGRSLHFEMHIVFNTGVAIDAEVAFSSFEYHDEVAYQGVIHDITKRLQILRELKESKERAEESERLKSAFLATMSHEYRTPLNQIIGFSGLIPQFSDNEHVVDFAAHINKSGQDLLALVEDLFQLSMVEKTPVVLRRNTVKIGDVFDRLNDHLQDFLYASGKANAIQIECDIRPESAAKEIVVDTPKLLQAIVQILKNAVKFTHEGSIRLSLDLSENNVMSIKVADTGIGIPEDKLSIVFDFFRQADESLTREYGGVGVGLALSKKIAEAMNAEIRVQTCVHKGSTFTYELPVEMV